MQIINVPAELQPPPHAYPIHTTSNIERYFLDYAKRHAAEIKTDRVYLPILWTDLYVAERNHERRSDFKTSRRASSFMYYNLEVAKNYFVIVQNDEGLYGKIPPNVRVYCAGGVGDVAVPLLCDPHPVKEPQPRTVKAFFQGQIECGGPVSLPGNTLRTGSSWDPNGAGARCRRAMFKELHDKPGFDLSGSPMTKDSSARFVNKMQQSVFALCPRGYGKTSFRLYEACQLQTIPIYIYDEPWLPFTPPLNWNDFSILCHVSEIAGLADRLNAISDAEVLRLQTNLREIYPAYFSYEGACRQIVQHLETYQ